MDIAAYLQTIEQTSKQCGECSKTLMCIQTHTNRVWKEADICDTCWSTHSDVRDQLWEQIKQYRPIECAICSAKQLYVGERFHYDHLNMFDKDKSVCSMINEGMDVEDICREIDKSQILCLSCHHIVTDIERRFGFTRIKQALSRSLNQGEFSEEQYESEMAFYQQVYTEKMQNVYVELRNSHLNN
jgi:DNA-directed RNA polymerase subunit RPC12/RpoP